VNADRQFRILSECKANGRKYKKKGSILNRVSFGWREERRKEVKHIAWNIKFFENNLLQTLFE
jgi:hypothetical protein